MKDASNFLRGTIAEGLLDRITDAVPSDDDVEFMKFHGIYQEDDRDLRDERPRQRLEPAYQFMIRGRLPGGSCTPAQWLRLMNWRARMEAIRYASPPARPSSLRGIERQFSSDHSRASRDAARYHRRSRR